MKRNNIARVALGVVRKFAPGVKKVSDADEDLLISVTDRDFKAGKKKDHGDCALAVAAKRQEHAAQVIVSSSVAYVIKGDHAVRYKVPEAASKEIVAFDRGAEFAAGDYMLKKPPKSARLGTYRGKDTRTEPNNRPKTGGMAKRFVHHTANIRENLKNKTWFSAK
jgi:hypothetical protein